MADDDGMIHWNLPVRDIEEAGGVIFMNVNSLAVVDRRGKPKRSRPPRPPRYVLFKDAGRDGDGNMIIEPVPDPKTPEERAQAREFIAEVLARSKPPLGDHRDMLERWAAGKLNGPGALN
jgi:hypothetical protein